MICPNCKNVKGGALEAYERKRVDGNGFQRLRICTDCSARYHTRETILRPLPDTPTHRRVDYGNDPLAQFQQASDVK